MTGPLVSIIVPSFNQGRFLRATLDSIFNQDHRPIEVIVVDGASSDETVSILEEYAARFPELIWSSEPDDGPADAVNKGLALARGEIAGIQSSDDLYLPGAIRAVVAAFLAQPELGIVYGDAGAIYEDGAPAFPPDRQLPYTVRRHLCGSALLLQSATFFRPQLARELGGWRPDCYVCDLDLWVRMAFRTDVARVPAVLSVRRLHPAQRDKQTAEIWRSYWQMIEESEDIKRADLRTRLAAKAGRRLLVQHYNPTGSAWYRSLQLWLAIGTYPPSMRAIRDTDWLFPYTHTLRSAASRLRHTIVAATRPTS